MPLPHQSLSHGEIAFGFFNIESDMLLLQHCFFFADAFCAAVEALSAAVHGRPPAAGAAAGAASSAVAGHEASLVAVSFEGFRIVDPAAVGDLTGAIHGLRFTGFIGALYRRFPFPRDPAAFRQQPEGHRTQDEVRALILEHGVAETFTLGLDMGRGEIRVAEFTFSRAQFDALLGYLWRGGHPRWRDGIRPAYVERLQGLPIATTELGDAEV